MTTRRDDDFDKAKHVGLLKSLERNIMALFKMGRIERIAKSANERLKALTIRVDQLTNDVQSTIDEKLSDYSVTVDERLSEVLLIATEQSGRSTAYHAEASRAFSDLSHRLDFMDNKSVVVSTKLVDTVTANPQINLRSEGLTSFLSFFYNKLENRYRGSRSEIKSRLKIYLPDAEAAVLRTGGKTALDLGCGRGEWLELLRDEGLNATGVDLNTLQLEEARAMGLVVEEQDAMLALSDAETNSLSIISAHHLIEHLPFSQVAWIVREAMRTLAPGGILILETPNVQNILVGASSFHNDPTHIKPLTGPVLQVLFETAGFEPIDIRHLHPHEKLATFISKSNFEPELAYLLFGAQDIAIIGYKPESSK